MYRKIKRLLDTLCSFLAILILSPVFLIIIILVKTTSKGPVFFAQKRVGLNQRYFLLYKFRSMRTDTPSEMPTHLLGDSKSYVTGVGKFLRKSSLDELPQLFNILRGDMSVVGPRPALWNQEDLILLREEAGVHSVLPGLTGWAQVNGRDELEIKIKARFDAEYVANMSFKFDVKIIFMTITQVFRGKGVTG